MLTSPRDWTGVTLKNGRYEVRAKLGQGGMAEVYQAWDLDLQHHVVVKSPHPSLLSDPQFLERFRREIRSLVSLSHPHIVKILDVGEQDRLPFAVLQFLGGGSLEDRLSYDDAGKVRPVRPEFIAEWLPQVAAALDFIALKGFVHRDVKPANILFDEDGHVYLSDFGIAKALDSGAQQVRDITMTGTGMVIGTPRYLAPEVVLSQPYDGRADQYALAVTVYELLAGRPPYDGPSVAYIAVQQQVTQPTALTELCPAAPAGQCAAVMRGISREPRDRFPDCRSFATAATQTGSGFFSRSPTSANESSGFPAAHSPTTGSEKRNPTPSVPPPLPPRVSQRPRVSVGETARRWVLAITKCAQAALAQFAGKGKTILRNCFRASLFVFRFSRVSAGEMLRRCVLATVTRADAALAQFAGEGNTILLNFLRGCILVFPLLATTVGTVIFLRSELPPKPTPVAVVPEEPKPPVDTTTTPNVQPDPEPPVGTTPPVMLGPRPLVLFPISEQTVDEESVLRLNVSVKDRGAAVGELTYELVPGTPSGAMIDAQTGVLTWKPTEEQGPGTYSLGVRVREATSTNNSPLEAATTVRVHVREVNQPPVLVPIVEQTSSSGRELKLQISATDADVPKNRLAFQFVGSVPTGALLDSETGVFCWTPVNSDAGKSHRFRVRVTDTGLPPASVYAMLSVVVESLPLAKTFKTFTNGHGMEFILFPAGEFLRGSPDSDKDAENDEKPQHRVRITEPFYLGKYEVTQGQYQQVMGNNPSCFSAKGDDKARVKGVDTSRLSVENVSWEEATAFCRKLGGRYRLPTEAEWEYACRAGNSGIYGFGNDAGKLVDYDWYDSNKNGMTHAVGGKQPNAWGLHDMQGNVSEWCADFYKSDEYQQFFGTVAVDPQGPTSSSYRVIRGGGWNSGLRHCRASFRNRYGPVYRGDHLGFRVAAGQLLQ